MGHIKRNDINSAFTHFSDNFFVFGRPILLKPEYNPSIEKNDAYLVSNLYMFIYLYISLKFDFLIFFFLDL